MAKIRLIFFFFFFFFLVVLIKLFYLQVFNPISTADNYLQYKKVTAQRGRIFDRNNQPLALNKTSYLLYIEPKKMKDKDNLIQDLDEILKIGEATLESKIDETKDWVAVKSGIDKDQKEKLSKLKLPEIGFEEQYQRTYPEASLSAHLLGFVGKNEKNEDIGYFGVEGYYEKDLAGLPGLIKGEKDIFGRHILLGRQEVIEPENGRDLVLTIDISVQEIIKQKLKAGVERYDAKEGCIIVAEPKTMEILGLSCLPDFDPDKYFEFTQDDFGNLAISSLYEPGSTFKPTIMAAAINEKKVKINDTYNEKGPIERSEYEIRTWNNKYTGKITMTQILERSSNVGMVYVGDKLGKKNIVRYLRSFGFGERTGIDLQGETTGFLKNENQWYDIDYATVSFGQGIAVSPIQMITAFSSVINGGNLMQPYIVKKIVYPNDEEIIKPKKLRRVISEKTSEIIRKMLISTVKNGEYKWQIPKGYKIGGKTGTAQIPVQGKYDPSKTIASFIGFAPADDPKFIALVVLKEPGASIYGSETAAPLFFEIAKDLFVYYNIAPN